MKQTFVIALLLFFLLVVKGDEHLLTDYIQDFSDKEKIYDHFVTEYVKSLNITDWLNVLVLEAPKDDPDIQQVKEYITLLVGEAPPDAGEYSTDGIYSGLSQAYRIRFIADPKWNMLNYFAKTLDEYEDNIYDTMRGIYKTLKFDVSYCDGLRKEKFSKWESAKDKDDPLSFIKQLNAASELDDNITEHCLNHPGASQLTFSKDLTATTLELYRDSLALTCLTLDLSVNFDVWPVNGRKPNRTGKLPQAHFWRMLEETRESELEIYNNLEKLKEKWHNDQDPDEQRKAFEMFDKFNRQIKRIYYNGSSPIRHIRNSKLIKALQRNVSGCYHYFKWVDCSKCKGSFKNISIFRHDFIEREKHRLTKKVIYGIWPNLQVDNTLANRTARRQGEKGKWKFDPSKPYVRIRTAWTYLGNFSEFMKCEMKKSYWLDLREKALKDAQVKLEDATLFTYFSKTLYQPCKTNDTDLVGECTFLNNEICRPVIPSEAHQLHMDESGDLSYLRHKFVYEREKSDDDDKGKCKAETTFAMPFKICRCGFRTGCKSKLHHNKNPMVCALIPNDNIRRQCRGNLGYPCYSQPLAPKMYDESCATGYCNIYKDSCQQPPYNKFPKVKG